MPRHLLRRVGGGRRPAERAPLPCGERADSDKLRDVLTVDEDGDTVRSEGGRCPFLPAAGFASSWLVSWASGRYAAPASVSRGLNAFSVQGVRRLSLVPRGGERDSFETEEPTEFVTEETDEPAASRIR